jgi:hypothetical protein
MTFHNSPTPPERFDANQVELAGLVNRIWARGSDVFARLDTGEPSSDEDEDDTRGYGVSTIHRATLRFPLGQVGGREVSLCKGDWLRLNGYLEDLPREETLRDFLLKAEKLALLDEQPALQALEARARRSLTCVIPEKVEPAFAQELCNAVRIEGVVAKVWEYDGHRFARLAVYDRHSTVTTRPGKNGHPRRIPHYITVQFSDGEVNGRTVALKAKERCRISGALVDRPYSENLRSFLLDTHQAEVLAQIPNSDDVAELRIRRSSACVIAQTMIQFTR